ncbi:hypothetical protein QQF64_033429 [Cirrhinus molitorella]|uniref:Uncharacterized protein n=1 Tax=Cirrhinus molitorella TaxID=172907 RepID=A0ABR3MTW5_9TELE
MSVCGCACQLFGFDDLMEPCQDKIVTLTPHTNATSSPITRLTRCNPTAVCSARQASLEWAKKQMAGDSISHQRENRSSVAHPPELHQPPCHTHTHTPLFLHPF